VAGGILFFNRSFFLAKGSSRWLYRQATFIAQKIGYRCKFKNWVQNLGTTPIKIWGRQPPNIVTHGRGTWSKLIIGIGRENKYPKLVSKFCGGCLPPKKFEGGQSLEISILKLASIMGYGSHSLQIFTSGSGS